MADHMKKVQSGNPLVIPAQAYNAFIDAAVDYCRRTAHIGQQSQPSFRQGSIVLVRNDSGSNQNRLAVLGIDTPIIDPASNDSEFKNRVALSCVTPAADTHEGKFVILVEPLASGKIGRAYVAGVCPVQIDVPDKDIEYPFAEIADGITDNLKAAHYGSASILWRAGGTGVQWAVVRIGVSLSGMVLPVLVTVDGGSAGGPTADCSFTYTVKDLKGNQLAAELTPQVPRLTNVEYLPPAENSPGLAYLDAAGAVKLYHVAGEVPKTDRVRLQTQYRIDGANNKFQVKYRYVRVLEAEDEDAVWSDVHTGTECPN